MTCALLLFVSIGDHRPLAASNLLPMLESNLLNEKQIEITAKKLKKGTVIKGSRLIE